MKNKILKTLLFFVLFSTLLITASFAVEIKEDVSNYESDVYIIGSTRFDANQTITADMAANAGLNEAKVQVALKNDISSLKVNIYFYDAIFGDWYQINKAAKADLIEDTTTIENIENNLNIFYEEGVEKTLEVSYDGDVDTTSITNNVTYKDGKFLVPATTFSFKFSETKEVEGEKVVVASEVATNVDKNVTTGTEVKPEIGTVSKDYAAKVGSEYFEDFALAMSKATTENSVVLLKNIDLPTAVEVTTKVTLDLNGKTLTAKNDTEGNGIFWVKTGGDLTINGEGTIDSACQTNDYSMAVWATGTGKVTINGGTFTNKGAKSVEDDGETPNNNELIYASVSGQITINGGTFIGNIDNEEYGARYTLNLKDQDNQVASILVKGGTFTGYDPANSKSENPTKNLVAEGYESKLGADDVYTVVKKAN